MAEIKFINKIIFLILVLAFSFANAASEPQAGEAKQVRLSHARELLGRHYKRSIVRSGEAVRGIEKEIYLWTKHHLHPKFKRHAKAITHVILEESERYEFDPALILSVIQSESSFNPRMIGGVGEIGLMQIRPTTGKWMAKRAGVSWKGRQTLFDPIKNIKIGAAFLNYLRDEFDSHAQLYLAAYNMGQGNVRSALDQNIWPKDYPTLVMKNYVGFYSYLKTRSERMPASVRRG